MKKLNLFLGALITIFFISCEGPQGPPGFDGFDGERGPAGQDGVDAIQAQVFELEGVNFMYDATDNLYDYLITFSDFTSFETFKEDVVLIYRYDGPVEFGDGAVEDSWGLLPQNYFFDEGIIQYVFSHTLFDAQVFIDGNFDLSTLSTDFTDNQILRVVIIPGEIATTGKLDTSNINSVMAHLGITEESIQKVTLD
ncbi:collagen-like protein [Maribacter stanieri]|uniref:collagen-like triple helix repeat-containing protein n=1 Tax=Maribacter stanieri TaxID=440514 RepID=UPI0030D987A4|tara:strand:- start:738 stop:1325 length:588 start_codon:yes stop_codon:yes gene_type:complete